MYCWSAHVGTQENGSHDVWHFSYEMVAYIFPMILPATAVENKIHIDVLVYT